MYLTLHWKKKKPHIVHPLNLFLYPGDSCYFWLTLSPNIACGVAITTLMGNILQWIIAWCFCLIVLKWIEVMDQKPAIPILNHLRTVQATCKVVFTKVTQSKSVSLKFLSKVLLDLTADTNIQLEWSSCLPCDAKFFSCFGLLHLWNLNYTNKNRLQSWHFKVLAQMFESWS